jgi:spore coat polysaccharide biosynthesis protein SpsF (cytidylyltransferase family)
VKTVAIIQARMTSTRLPGKILADIAGKPLLYHVVSRARQARTVDLVVVATTDLPTDDPTQECCRSMDVPCFRGSEDDVLDRYYRAAEEFPAEAVVRLTADCPLLDPRTIDNVVRFFHKGGYDYVCNTMPPTYPDGLDTEVFRRESLTRAWHEARLQSEREHVTPYIWKQPGLFRIGNVANDTDYSKLRWTVDEPADLEFVRHVYAHFGATVRFGMTEILDLLMNRPEIQAINAGFERNEGYFRSLKEDKK